MLNSQLLLGLAVLVLITTSTRQAQAQSHGYWINDHLEYNGEHRQHDDNWMSDYVTAWATAKV